MRCNFCGYRLSNEWKVCPKCANEVIFSNLPFNSKHKDWVDKHLVHVNVFYGFPFNMLYTFLPAFLIYLYFEKKGASSDALTIDNVFSTLLSISALYPFLILLFAIIFMKVMLKSFKLAKYAVKSTNDKKYYYFIAGDVVGIVILLILAVYFVF